MGRYRSAAQRVAMRNKQLQKWLPTRGYNNCKGQLQNCATFSEHLLAIFVSRFCPAFCSHIEFQKE
jgi:hypothetical protein